MTEKVRRTIAIYEMLTLVATLINVVSAAVAVKSNAIPPVLWGVMVVVMVVVLVLAVASFVAGVGLWRDRPSARRLSLVVQALQVPRIAIAGIVNYSVALGLSLVLSVGIAPTGMQQPVHIVIALGGGAGGFFLGINVLALTALVLVARWRPVGAGAAEVSVETA